MANTSNFNKNSSGNKIALFVGSDVTALLILNGLIPMIKDLEYEPIVFFPVHKPASKKEKSYLANQPEIKEVSFYERDILVEICDILDAHDIQSNVAYTPRQLGAKRGISQTEPIDDINNPDFVKRFESDEYVGGISIRCYQIFKEPLINVFKQKPKNFLWNIHPGKLKCNGKPEHEYRGIYTPLRVMLHDRQSNYWTLHEIDKGIDTGPIVYRLPHSVDLAQPMINMYLDYAPYATAMISQKLEEFKDNGKVPSEAAHRPRGKLYSFPEPEEIKEFKKRNYTFVNPEQMVSFYMSKFVNLNERAGRLVAPVLEMGIRNAMRKFYERNPSIKPDDIDFDNNYYDSLVKPGSGINLIANDNTSEDAHLPVRVP